MRTRKSTMTGALAKDWRLWIAEAQIPFPRDQSSPNLQILSEKHILVRRLSERLVWYPCKQMLSVCLTHERLRHELHSKVTSVASRFPSDDLVV
jgi:hypothetical protein